MNWAANKTADDMNDKTIMRKNKTNGWYTDEVKEAKLDRNSKQELHELVDNDELAENLRQAKNNYRNLLRDSKNDYEHKEAVKLEQLRHLDQQSFWEIFRSKLKEKIEVECSIEQLKLEYSALFSERIADESYEANEAAKEVADFMKRTESENYADKAITSDELSKIISSLSNNKSIRPSGVSNEMIKHCESGVVFEAFRLLISKSLSLGTIPEDSNKAYIKPLIKDGSKLRDDIFPDHISSKISGQAEKIAQLDKLGFSLKSTNQLSKGFYYNTYVRSYLLHGADALVLSKNDLIRYKTCEGNTIKYALGLPSCLYSTELMLVLKINTTVKTIQKHKVTLFLRLLTNVYTKKVILAVLSSGESRAIEDSFVMEIINNL